MAAEAFLSDKNGKLVDDIKGALTDGDKHTSSLTTTTQLFECGSIPL
jgi:hypothetical protein